MLIGSYFREMPLCHLFDSLVSTLTFVAAAQCHVGNRSSNEDRGESTEYHTENHCEREAADAVTTEDEDTEQYDQCSERGVHGTGQCLIQRVVEYREEVALLVEAEVLTDTVEYHHLIVDRVTDNGKDSADERLVDLERERNDVPQE